MDYRDELAFAKTLALKAGEIINKNFLHSKITTKSNLTPVTETDVSISKMVINEVKKSKKIILQLALGIVMVLVLVLALSFSTKPRDPLALYYRASVLHNRGQYREAIEAYSKFIEEFPDSERPIALNIILPVVWIF